MIFRIISVLFAFSQLCGDPYFYFSPSMISTHLQSYTEEEKALIEKDLSVVRSVCFANPIQEEANPVYLATAGGPGSKKTTILERFIAAHSEYAHGIYIDPDPRALRYMVHTYYQSITPLKISESQDYQELLKQTYNKWRFGSTYIAVKLLEEAFQNRQTVIHGTTSTGTHIPTFYPKLKERGYKIVLLLCSCEDSLRGQSIAFRNEKVCFYQSSPEDAIAKGKLFPERMLPFFQYADTLYLFWNDELFQPERLAAVLENGKMEVKDPEALRLFIDKYESDRSILIKEGKTLLSFDELVQTFTSRGQSSKIVQ